MYTAISEVNSNNFFLLGRPKGGVEIFCKKSLNNKIKQLKSTNYTCLLLSVYLPCSDLHFTVLILVDYLAGLQKCKENKDYAYCIDYIESLLESKKCDSFICCSDYNTSFERANAQTE